MSKEIRLNQKNNGVVEFGIPTHLIDRSVNEIFEDVKYAYGLTSIFFQWAERRLRNTWPGKRLCNQDFEDIFHDSFLSLVVLYRQQKIIAEGPLQLFCLLKTIFIRASFKQGNDALKKSILTEDESELINNLPEKKEPESFNICNLIDRILMIEDNFTIREKEFLELLKEYPEEKNQIISIMGITIDNYNTIFSRVISKIKELKLEQYLLK